MKILFYLLFGAFGLLGGSFVVSGLVGHFAIEGMPVWVAKLVLVVSALAGAGLFYRAYVIGELEQRWGGGVGMVVAGIVVFEVIPVMAMLVGGMVKKFG